MKCPKCNAENINEAVKCGICGARLKHIKQNNIFTGSSNVESSVRRENKKAPTPPKQGTPPESKSLTESLMDKNVSIEDKARIFLDSWQDKAKDTWGDTQNPKKKKNLKIVWILLAVFMFGPAVLGIVASVVIPAVMSVIGITNVDHSDTDEDAEATDVATAAAEDINADDEIDSIKNQLFSRYSAVEEFQKDIEKYYQKTGKLPTQLKQLEPYTETGFSDYTYQYFAVGPNGSIVGLFRLEPEKKIYAVPEIRHKKIVGWTCYSIGIDDDLLKDCQYLDHDPFK
ncbi:zinc ribbon domain-containing protein [Acinetobacter bereziniae]|uniref:zinc ribbon domain-containing protein n=1 Tax=Acinetobacter bereziniae TaxID=106648 RepID=UPI001901C037|nr:zinc ribbon domain-containing protein [Acinetobacter bereziniae]MBJ8442948.1 zinc ribbon domain-containing protein [Acinetobacter bereziniae]